MLMILAFIVSAYLAVESDFFKVLLLVKVSIIFLPFADLALKSMNIHLVLLRFVTHFLSMNLALFIGLLKYLKGVKSNVWQPTQRNQ